VALPEELSSLRVEPLAYRLKILGCNLSLKAKQVSAAAAPPTFDSPILVVVVTLPKVPLGIALTAGHGTNRQHSPTLTLFEIRDQPVVGDTHLAHRCASQMSSKRAPLADSKSTIRGRFSQNAALKEWPIHDFKEYLAFLLAAKASGKFQLSSLRKACRTCFEQPQAAFSAV
jgi:hypothetical protein